MKYVVMLLLALMQRFSIAETIAAVILHSNSEYMARLDYINQDYSPKIVQSYARVLKQVNPDRLLFLRVIDTNRLFGISSGNTIVLDIYFEQLDEVTREFAIAHELGHIVLKHEAMKIALYEKHVGNHAIKELSQQCELDADTFALRTLVKLGWTRIQVVSAFIAMKQFPASKTHPSSQKRIENLLNVPI